MSDLVPPNIWEIPLRAHLATRQTQPHQKGGEFLKGKRGVIHKTRNSGTVDIDSLQITLFKLISTSKISLKHLIIRKS